MATENILQSIGTTGGIKFFPGTYVPTDNPRYSLVYDNFFNMSFTIDSISILNDIVVVGVSSIQTVYVYKIVQNILNLIKTITPQNSSLHNTISFGKVVKLVNSGILVSDPDYTVNGAVFFYFCTKIGLQSWLENPAIILPYGNSNMLGINFGVDMVISDTIIVVTAYQDNNTYIFKYVYDYIKKYIKQTSYITVPSSDNALYPYQIRLINNTYLILNEKVTYKDDTFQNNLNIYDINLNAISLIENDQYKLFDYFYTYNNNIIINNKNTIDNDDGTTIDNDIVSLYTILGDTVNLKTTFNSQSLKIDNNTDDVGIVYMDNNFIIWNINNTNKIYVVEISEVGNIIPSTNSYIEIKHITTLLSIDRHGNNIVFSGYNDNKMTVLVTYDSLSV